MPTMATTILNVSVAKRFAENLHRVGVTGRITIALSTEL